MVMYWVFTGLYGLFSFQNILVIITFIILTWIITSMLLFRDSGIPGPEGNAIIGHFLQIKRSKDIIQTFEEWGRIYGPIVEFRPLGIFGQRRFLISDADVVKQILVTNSSKYERFTGQVKLTSSSARGLFGANGKEHSRQRKMINPAFKVSNLKGMVDVFERKTKLLVQVWTDAISNEKDSNEGTSLPVQSDMSHLTLDVLGECAFSYQFNSVTEGHSSVSSAFDLLLRRLTLRGNSIDVLPILRHIPTNAKRTELRAQKITDDVIVQIIHQKRETQNNVETLDEKELDRVRHKDLLDLLMEACDEESGQRMSKEELHSQVFVFMLAGHETSSVTLSWTLYFLAQYPEIQEKVRREIEETLKDNDPEWDTFESMEYLAAVINESMRLRPPAALFLRAVTIEDDILGYKIPPGSLVLPFPYLLHRLPEYWKDPDTFNPNRFLTPEKDENPSHRYAYLPFGTGPRICIGYKFALMEVKVVLSILLQNFAFSMIPGRSFQATLALTYKPKPSLELLVKKL